MKSRRGQPLHCRPSDRSGSDWSYSLWREVPVQPLLPKPRRHVGRACRTLGHPSMPVGNRAPDRIQQSYLSLSMTGFCPAPSGAPIWRVVPRSYWMRYRDLLEQGLAHSDFLRGRAQTPDASLSTSRGVAFSAPPYATNSAARRSSPRLDAWSSCRQNVPLRLSIRGTATARIGSDRRMIVNRTLSTIALIAMAGTAVFTGGCATHHEVVAAPPPPPPAETQTMQQTDQTQMNEQQMHRGQRG